MYHIYIFIIVSRSYFYFVQQWESRMINIHPSLLPAFKGLDTHARALAAGVKIHGASVQVRTTTLVTRANEIVSETWKPATTREVNSRDVAPTPYRSRSGVCRPSTSAAETARASVAAGAGASSPRSSIVATASSMLLGLTTP